jgi:ribosomal protein L1
MAEDKAKKAELEEKEAEIVAEAAPVETKEEKIAKAGKRSAKALKEADELQAKEERKAGGEDEEQKPKQPVKPTRSRLERQGKNFRKAAEKIEKDKAYALNQGLKLAVETNPAKFDASVELHINLSVDPRHADQNIRDSIVLPAGTGKKVRVAVFSDDEVKDADLSGIEKISGQLEKGQIDFDVLISTPASMAKLGKYARLLGPRGLMPNPKSGTVTPNVEKAVQEAKAGRVEYRVDSTGIVHLAIGKVSFGAAKLEQNARAVISNIKANKPASVKGTFVKAIHLATTMGPSISVDTNEA